MTKARGGALRLMFISLLIPFAAACGGDDDTSNSTGNPNDADNDGFTVEGGDCNDANPWIKPGAVDIPGDGIDQDCSGEDAPNPLDVDDDGDGFSENEGDCRDSDNSIHPDATDICGDGIDQDCSGGDAECSAVDGDADGFTPAQGDCDDADADVSPRADEIPYNGKDDDCDPETPDDDVDGDGFSKLGGGDCDDDDATIFPGADETSYDGIDQDCSGNDLTDVDRDGYAGGTNGDDCDDLNPAVRPNGVDVCGDGLDQDCSGADLVCDDLDRDNDGFSTNDGDCNDDDDTVGPGIAEVPYNGIDDDCDPATKDDDLDGDGFAKNGGGDCDDDVATIFPGAREIPYDGIDQSCSGADLVDVDNDGYEGGPNGTDCDDTRADMNPGVTEIPFDGVDQDCEGTDFIIAGATDFTVGVGYKGWVQVASNGQKQLVTWNEYRNGASRTFGVMLDANGVQQGGEFEIAANSRNGSVASDGTNFLVAYRRSTGYYAQRVSASGALTGGEITLTVHPYEPSNSHPSVAFGNGTYMVALQDNQSCVNFYDNLGAWKAYSVSIDGTAAEAGRIVDANVSCADSFGSGPGTVTLASNGSNFLAVWKSNNEVRGQLLLGDGQPTGSEFVETTGYANDRAVKIASDGTQYLLVFGASQADQNVMGLIVGANGVVSGSPFPISNAPGNQLDFRVTFTGSEYLVSFADERWNFWSIFGQRVGTDGTLLGTGPGVNYGLLANAVNYNGRYDVSYLGGNATIFWGSSENGGVLKRRVANP